MKKFYFVYEDERDFLAFKVRRNPNRQQRKIKIEGRYILKNGLGWDWERTNDLAYAIECVDTEPEGLYIYDKVLHKYIYGGSVEADLSRDDIKTFSEEDQKILFDQYDRISKKYGV